MATLEQIKLLETKLGRAINFVTQLTEENNRLKKRNDDLEETIIVLQEEKTRVEEGIVSALGKLNQFEDAIERSLSSVKNNPKPTQKAPDSFQAKAADEPQVKTIPAEKQKPVVPSVYTEEEAEPLDLSDEEPEESDGIEDSGEAELDIF